MSSQILRTFTLNGFEKFYFANKSWTIIACVAHLSGNHSVLLQNASYVVQCLLKRYSRMRTRLRIDNDQYLLDTLEYNTDHFNSDLFFSTVEDTDHTWEEIAERGCNQNPYSYDGTFIFPMCHFLLLFDRHGNKNMRFHLILFQNHCAFDGRSGFILINDFLTLATNPDLFSHKEPISNEVLPLMTDIIRRPLGPMYPVASIITKTVYKHKLRQLMHPRILVEPTFHPQSNVLDSNIQHYQMKVLFNSSVSDLYPKLHQQCRLHSTTLHGPLTACLLMAIDYCFPQDNINELKPMAFTTVFDMRTRVPQPILSASCVGCFVGHAHIMFARSRTIATTRFWSFARQCMRRTQKQLSPIGVPLITNMLRSITKHSERFDRFFYEGRMEEFLLSNIGKYPFSCTYNGGEIKLHGLHIANVGSYFRASNAIYVTCAGEAQLDFSFVHDMQSDEKAKQFFDYYIRLIETCADPAHSTIETTIEQLLRLAASHIKTL